MSDDERAALRPATVQEIKESLSFGLLYEGRKRVHHADNLMAEITVDRLVRHLERSGFVIMCRREAKAPSTSRHRHPNADPA